MKILILGIQLIIEFEYYINVNEILGIKLMNLNSLNINFSEIEKYDEVVKFLEKTSQCD